MYRMEPAETAPQAIEQASDLLTTVFGAKAGFTSPYLRWLYAENPAGPVVGFNAFAEGVLAAHYVTVPVAATLEGRAARGLLSLNTATHPAHQGKQLFTQLANRTFEAAVQQGFEFAVGVANANSTPGFVRKLGFQLVSPLDARVGIGVPACRARTPAAFERTWDEASLTWRLRCPTRRYMRSGPGRDGRVTVLAPTAYPGILASLALIDSDLLGRAAPQLTQAGWSARVWLGLDPDIDWRRSPFFELPRAVRPSPLNFIFKPLAGQTRALTAGSVRFAAMDFDAY